MTSDARADSTLTIDGKRCDDSAFPHVWSRCIGAGRANEALRADWQRQFADVVEACGVRYIRFHGVFHDDMFVYRESYGGGFGPDAPLAEPVYTFSYVDKVFDFILDCGVRPFVELGFMPRELATVTETLFWWGAHGSPPKDMARWVELVTRSVEHWIDRYGLDEVREWRFEVWNEPNLVPHFWTGTKTEYFELYEQTVTAIKNIDPALKVGGPATSVFVPDDRYKGEVEDRVATHETAAASDVDALDWRPVWIEDFIAWCAERGLPIDFVSTHTYPTDFAFAADGEAVHITRYADATFDDLTLLRELVGSSAYPDAEIHITEWSTSPSSRDFIHDTVFAATSITRSYLQCATLADSISYWTFTDVFEEGGAGIGPFHGGFGLVNEGGVHKPTFHALTMLERLGDRLLLATSDGVVTRDSRTSAVSAVFFNYPDDMGMKGLRAQNSYEGTRALAEMGPSRRIRHSIGGLEPGSAFLVEIVDWEHGNVAEAWYRLGPPLNPSRAEIEHLSKVADSLLRFTLTVPGTGVLDLDVELAPWAVMSLRQPA
ncbi:GH39 family glycosyl hydrolase [Microbispora bryophytorum]|uniref:Beta-xylosidase n=1 Tax=Microbispora bryophytorum TaxID=1460882 RepID=A0A8H9LDR9_9ACTN|nr:beta-xylosidase [Microbispora bryophytorum]MBD3137431.1 beta-xylosidase [Microbispora bryophytorum]TQR99130.1 beta-xylosidase [Microbispora bryophytorum]GGO32115.1 beta-xylosidase [Microbispora bryophytorum]